MTRLDPLSELGTVAAPLRALLGGEGSVRIGGLAGGAIGRVLAAVARQDGVLLILVADARRADALRLDLDAFLPEPSRIFPTWPRTEGSGGPDPEVLQARVGVLDALAARRRRASEDMPLVVVAPLPALCQSVPSLAVLQASALLLKPEEEHEVGGLLEHLALSGQARVGAVETQGEFAFRGGVLDVWPWGADGPARLDFFGDEIESVRALDPATQRSGDLLEEVRLLALPAERFRHPAPDEDALLPGHLPADTRIAKVEPENLAEAAARLAPEARQGLLRLEALLAERRALDLSSLGLGQAGDLDVDVGGIDILRGIALRGLEGASAGHVTPTATVRTQRIATAFGELARRVDKIVVHCRASGEEQRLRELFDDRDPGVPVTWRRGSLSRSFRFGPTRTAHVAYDDLADLPVRERRVGRIGPRGRPIQDFLELEVGSPVVHLHHGIGMFRGLATLDGKDGEGEFLRVEFAGGTTVYVPVARIDLVQRYVGTGRSPKLSKVGGSDWGKRTRKVEAAVEDLALELLDTAATRAKRTRPPLPTETEWQEEFEASFPFPDTPDQASATRAIHDDLESDRPMDRLLCGDVGYGKTEVALRAIFKVVTAGRQAAILVPTKVLCEQHVRTFTRRLASYPVRVRPLSSLHAPRENKQTLKGLLDGTVDVVVGTHRLLGKDVAFKDLGLIVVDEEQRFGVKQKERLKSMRREVDILTLSATPIPRTLHMALLGIRDISNLTTPPLGRHPVETIVARESDEMMGEAVRLEMDRGGQVFVVNSRIRDLALVAKRIAERVPDARIVAIHGQMDKDLIENRMLRFVRGEADVMLATTIIESGLDIPNANTIILRDADRYGLAELHQLRGRVGRERRRAHCLLLLPPDRPIRDEAAERVRALQEYSELGAGFRIAMRDLEIRGAGNLLGAQQSGHIAAVGYDLFCKLLAQAVRRVQGEGEPVGDPAYLAVDLPAGIPDAWIPDRREKFRLFRRIATASDRAWLEDLESELTDRFGAVPPTTARLLLAQQVRLLAGRLGVLRIEPAERPGVILRALPGSATFDRLRRAGLGLILLGPTSAFLPLLTSDGPEAILRALVRRLEPIPVPPGR